MCKMKSMILTQDKVFCPDYDSHSDMLVEMGIKDDKQVPHFVKIEITPPSGDMRRPPEEWEYSVDQDWLPAWYVREVDEPRCRKSLVDWYGAHVFTEGHHEVHSGKVWLYGNATATLYGNATATLCDNATAKLFGNATAELFGSATATLYGSATAKLFDSATATLYGSATAKLYDRSVSIYRADYWARPVVRIAGEVND